ncbi:GNAT family N-acetyltransferase [Gracilibacillus massiliensis]|uniref:GNAT family N-acetyltransferase n=1 Tax=Gracilibacillus massiliensis TaxID=1564956 RepID=UPI00071CA6AD|nr:GNAT family N-acetyltransferase [Gracilibacillus massiliensis]
MIDVATDRDLRFILARAKDSANEGVLQKNVISQAQALQMVRMILEEGAHYLVYRNSDQSIAGWILIGENIDLINNQPHAYIFELYVLPPYRNYGIAKHLLQAAIDANKQRGYNEIRLNVFANNLAKKIYKQIGFQDVHTTMTKKL